MSGKNKKSLVLFMEMKWKKLAPEEFHGKTVCFIVPRMLHVSPKNDMNEVIPETVQELTSDHEKKDTLFFA